MVGVQRGFLAFSFVAWFAPLLRFGGEITLVCCLIVL